MKKKESKATKPAKKSLPVNKPGRGGARPNAGRKKKYGETQQISIDAPTAIIAAMEKGGIVNKTEYIISLIAKDLKVKL